MLLGVISRSIASHTARARSGASAAVNCHDLLVGRVVRMMSVKAEQAHLLPPTGIDRGR